MKCVCIREAVLVSALVTATGAKAHIQEECRPLFVEAAHATDGVVRKGNEANEAAMVGLDNWRSITVDDFNILADRLAQLLGWQTDMFIKLTEAIECVQREHSGSDWK